MPEPAAALKKKNAAEIGDAKAKNNTKKSATSPLSGSPAAQGSLSMASKPVTAAADSLGIYMPIYHQLPILSRGRAKEPLNKSADLLPEFIGSKTLKFTKYSCGFPTSICGKISR
ncbi:MAG: hypothetical protein ACI4V3_10520 [Faecousia sp.]